MVPVGVVTSVSNVHVHIIIIILFYPHIIECMCRMRRASCIYGCGAEVARSI